MFGLFKKLKKKDEPPENYYFRRCNIAAISSFVPMLDQFQKQYPFLKNIKTEDWDFFVSIYAFSVFVIQNEKSALSSSEKEKIFETTYKLFCKKYPDFEAGSNDFRQFLRTSELPHEVMPGVWLASNLFRKDTTSLSQDELQVGLIISKHITIDMTLDVRR